MGLTPAHTLYEAPNTPMQENCFFFKDTLFYSVISERSFPIHLQQVTNQARFGRRFLQLSHGAHFF